MAAIKEHDILNTIKKYSYTIFIFATFNNTNTTNLNSKIFLPLFSRARGGIVAAGSELAKAKEERKAAKTTLITDLAVSYAGLTTAQSKVLALRAKVIPAMEEAFNAAQEGYRQGKFNFMDVLDAQRTLYDVKSQYIQSLSTFHKAIIGVERLIGQRIN